MIQVSGLKIKFGQRAIIDGIDFASARGKTVAVMGKNGSGKSTLLKALAGLIDIAEGTVLINGASRQDVAVRSVHRMCEKREAGTIRLAYVFQKGGLFDSMNVFDNTAFGLVRMGADPEDVRERVLSSLKRVGLAGSENKLPSELSGGMQKRVGIARAVCMEPDIIIYDDPTAGLDPVLSDSMADLMLEIKDSTGAASVVATHDLHIAEKTADTIILLYGGRAVFNGDCAGFFSKQNEFARQFIDGDSEGPIDIF